MSLQHWLAFAAASAILVAIPGPTVLLTISYTLSHGRKAAMSIVAGVSLGDITAMTASMLGLGALLQASAAVFGVLKVIGAAYLIYLGISLWRAPVSENGFGDQVDVEKSPLGILLHAYVVTALNPKSIIFFVAFLPQFLDTTQPLLPQMLILGATFVTLAATNVTTYGFTANLARKTIRQPGVQRAVNRTGGTLIVGAGLLALGLKR